MILKNISFYTKGKRSLVFTALSGKMKVAIKIKNPESRATNRIENEGKWLRVLNTRGLGPKLIWHDSEMLIYRFIKGTPLVDYLKKETNKKKIKNLFKQILHACRTMDLLNIEKKEMQRPFKNVIIRKGKAVLIDFERCRKTKRPSNVTQFCQFLASPSSTLTIDRHKLIEKTRAYSQAYTGKSYFLLLDFLGF